MMVDLETSGCQTTIMVQKKTYLPEREKKRESQREHRLTRYKQQLEQFMCPLDVAFC